MASEIRRAGEDVISPELVLVSSPEEARRAREHLPAEPWSKPRARAASPTSVIDVNAQPRIPFLNVVGERSVPPPAVRLRSLVLAIPLAAALVAAGYLTEHNWLGRDSAHPVGLPATPSVPVSTATRATTEQPGKTNSPSRVAGRGAASSSSSKPLAPGEFVPARTWSWAPKPGAAAYDVTFYLNGRIVLHARTKAGRLVLPHLFRFQAGRYRWTVEAVPLVQGAPPIADSSFSVSTAAAEAANKQ